MYNYFTLLIKAKKCFDYVHHSSNANCWYLLSDQVHSSQGFKDTHSTETLNTFSFSMTWTWIWLSRDDMAVFSQASIWARSLQARIGDISHCLYTHTHNANSIKHTVDSDMQRSWIISCMDNQNTQWHSYVLQTDSKTH